MLTLTIAEIAGIVVIMGAISLWFRLWLAAKFTSINEKFEKQDKAINEKFEKQDKTMDELKKDYKSIEKEMDGVRNNYKSEFIKVRQDANQVRDTIVAEIHKLHISLVKIESTVEKQASVCKSIQDAKKTV